jgi:hypothetical protein
MRDTKGCGEEASPLFRGDSLPKAGARKGEARSAGNGEVHRGGGSPTREQGVTGREASAPGGRQSPPRESTPSCDALGAEPLGKCPVPHPLIQRFSGAGH